MWCQWVIYIYIYVRVYTFLKIGVRIELCFSPLDCLKVHDTISIVFLVLHLVLVLFMDEALLF